MIIHQERRNQSDRNGTEKIASILLIDDSHDVLSLNKIILELDGYIVFTAESGNEGFSILSWIEPPNLILLDIRMEDMSGPEFLLELKAKMPDLFNAVPIVFLTAMDEIPTTHALGSIRKPIEIDNFLSAVNHFIKLGKKKYRQEH